MATEAPPRHRPRPPLDDLIVPDDAAALDADLNPQEPQDEISAPDPFDLRFRAAFAALGVFWASTAAAGFLSPWGPAAGFAALAFSSIVVAVLLGATG